MNLKEGAESKNVLFQKNILGGEIIMTNLKKTLAVVLAFAMMLSMGSAFAYSDVEAGTTVSEPDLHTRAYGR